MFPWVDKRLRRWIARIFPGRYPQLYSALDNPMRVPLQEAAYNLVAGKYLRPDDRVLDVGFGLGYGLQIMASKAGRLAGVEVDQRAVEHARELVQALEQIAEVRRYDGKKLPYATHSFDVVTCIDVIEHVPDYMELLGEMLRVAWRLVIVSTPNRRSEFTRPSGRPRNRRHLREWSFEEFCAILGKHYGVRIICHFLDGPWEGPVRVGSRLAEDTMALTPVLLKVGNSSTQVID
jgi:2-polyprenyl-3-methyl-5-hydroxy-6-metoxy-1,4-benzoquinol methylase